MERTRAQAVNRDYLWLFLMNALWAVGYPATAWALRAGAAPSLIAALRLTVAFFLFAPYLRRVKRWSGQVLGLAAGLGSVGFALPLWLQIRGLYGTDAAIAALSISLEPLLTILGAHLIHRQRLFARQKAALVLALAGSWILTGEPRPGHLVHVGADLALFSAVFGFVFYNIFSARLTAATSTEAAAALTFGFGAAASLLVWLLGGAPHPPAFSWPLAGSLGFLAFGATAFAYFLWLWVVHRQGSVTLSALFLYLQPLLGSMLSWVLGDTRLSFSLIAGGILVLAAMTVGQEPRRPPLPQAPSEEASHCASP
ncbi:MAG: DMT family transporter [Firmicutes bacterium]|nr:DMT family transporter [Bacillota bacterium]